MGEIKEGLAQFVASLDKIPSRSMEVFYNPVMKRNRDITIAIWNALEMKGTFLDVFAGSGIRAIRMMLETKIKPTMYANDLSENAVKSMKENFIRNKVDCEVSMLDANAFLLKSKSADFVDIDPFGYPGHAINLAVRKVRNNGILAVTATDTSALCGTAKTACQIKYLSTPFKTDFYPELGIRILIRFVQLQGVPFEIGLKPIYSYSDSHYMRVFFKVKRGRSKALDSINSHGILLYCKSCLFRSTTSHIFNQRDCPNCHEQMIIAGPIYLGPLWDSMLARKLISDKFTEVIARESEIDSIGFYDIHKLCQTYKVNPSPRFEKLIAAINERGFMASRTHFFKTGIRTNCDLRTLISIVKNI